MGDKASVFKTDLGVIRNVHLGLSDQRAPESQYEIYAMISLIFKRCKVILTTKTLTIVVQEKLQLQIGTWRFLTASLHLSST